MTVPSYRRPIWVAILITVLFPFLCVAAVLLVRLFWVPTLTVNWNATRQTIDGFGASATGYTGDMSADQADRFFSADTGLGLSLLRIKAIAGTLDADCYCVSNHSPYKCIVGPDSQILTGDVRVAQLATARGVRLFAAPWSPPAEMKTSGQYCDVGSMIGTPANYSRYATELASFPSLLKAHGISIDALSIQNEPNVEDSHYDTCRWTGQQIHDFIPYLSDALRAANFQTMKIAVPEHTSWRFDLMKTAMDDPAVAEKVGLLLGHAYGAGRPSSLPAVRDLHVWQTEVSGFSPYDGSMSDGLSWAKYIHNYMSLGVNAWMFWNLDCGELYFNSKNNMCLTDHDSHFAKRAYVLGQYAKFVRPGWQRVAVTNRGWLQVTAYRGPKKEFAVVIVNQGRFAARNQKIALNGATSRHSQIIPWITSGSASLQQQSPVSLAADGSTFSYTIPAKSVVTFQGQAD